MSRESKCYRTSNFHTASRNMRFWLLTAWKFQETFAPLLVINNIITNYIPGGHHGDQDSN